MNVRTCAALLLAVGLPTAVFAVDYPEIEPNESKAQALTNGAFTLAAGDSVSGITTGTSTLAATTTATADTFLLKTTPAALGIYRHRMTITTGGTAGHTGTIRGLASNSGGVIAGGDVAVQTSSTSTSSVPPRMNQWYGFGKEEQLYYRVTGTASTTASYTSTLSTDVIIPVAAGTNPESGTITISDATGTGFTPYDNDMALFDSNFNPIVGIDDPDSSGVVASLTPGTYYFAYGTYANTAFGRLAGAVTAPAIGGIQGTYQTGNVMDFNDLVVNSRTTTSTTPTSISIAAPNGTQTLVGSPLNFYDVQWFTFTVVPSVTPTNPTGVGSASPTSVINDGTGVTTLRVTVTPGANPTSTFLTTGSVTVDGSGIGAGTVTLLDNGVAPDLVAGDNIFSADATVANGTAGGIYTMPFTITDDQSRVGTGNINLTVTTPPPPCASGLANLSFTGVQSNGAIADASNSVVSGDFGVAGTVNQVTITGRYTSYPISYRSEARVRMTAPDGTIYDTAAFAGAPASSGTWDVLGEVITLASLEDGTGNWTFEFWESFGDTVNPDAIWDGVCFTVDSTTTNPTGTGSATPSLVLNDGTGTTTFAVTVNPGANPTSTFLTTGSVVIDGSGFGLGSLTLLDDGVAPDAVAGDFIFSGSATVPNATPEGPYTVPFSIVDDQGRSGTGNIALTVTTPPPACPSGQATLSFNNVSSDGAIGDIDNSVVTGDFGIAGQINTLNLSGRLISFALYNLEARIAATSPDGSVYLIQPFTTTPSVTPRDLTGFTFTLPTPEDGTGTWTFEFYESYNDGATPDATWQQICFGADSVPTNPAATDTSTPGTVARDGVQTVTLAVTVVPGQNPVSSGVTVVVDDSSVGGSGSLALLDDGNAPDAAAGDNIFTGSTVAAYTTALGLATLPYTVADAESRSFAGSLNFTVTEASGACCTGSGCVVTTIGDCIDVQGGTFAGLGTACNSPTPMTNDGGAFEDISATGTLVAALTGADDGVAAITLPFTFNFFGTDYTAGNMSTNGNFQFGANNSTAYVNGLIPSAAVPNNALYVLWDDHDFDVTGAAYTELRGTIGVDARFIMQWNNVGQYNLSATPLDSNTFQIVLFEDGTFEYRYLALGAESAGSSGAGDTTTIGFEDATGTTAVTVPETRDSLIAQLPISYRGNSVGQDTGVCGNGCPPCAADYDNNGGVDGGDLGAFFADFEAGETCADVDQNGGVDGGDLGYFFTVFEAGGC